MNADKADLDAWFASTEGAAILNGKTFANADEFTKSLEFKAMPAARSSDKAQGFQAHLDGGKAMGCAVNPERKLAYKQLLYVIPSAAGLAGGVFRLPNSFIVPIVGGCAPCPWPRADCGVA